MDAPENPALATAREVQARRADALRGMADGVQPTTPTAEDLAEALRRTVAHLIECERQLDVFHGLGKDAGQGVSIIVCDAEALLRRFDNGKR